MIHKAFSGISRRFPFTTENIQIFLLFFIVLIQPYKELHSIYDVLLSLALVYSVVMIVKKKYPLLPRIFLYLFGAYTISILISTIFSIDFKHSIKGLKSEYLKQLIVFIIIIIPAAPAKRRLKTVVLAFFLSGFIMSTVGFVPYIFGKLSTDDIFNRLVSFSGSYTRLAYFYTLYIPFLALLIPIEKKSEKKIALYLLILISLTATFFTKTRAGWLCVPMATLLVFIVSKNWKNLAILLFIIIISSGSLFLFSPRLRWRAKSFIEMKDWSGSFGDRKLLWKSAGKSIKENPFIGAGYGKYIFRKIFEKHPVEGIESKSDTHNTFIEIMVQRGILGVITTLLLYLFFLKKAWMLNKNSGKYGKLYFAFFASITIAFIFFSMVDNIYVKETGRYLWQLAALGFCIQKIDNKETEEEQGLRR
jgi:O-antigen ligase